MANVTLYNQIDTQLMSMSEMTKNRMGGHSVYVSYDQKGKFIIQTPPMPVPFGMSTFTPKNGGNIKHTVDLSFRHVDSDTKAQAFHEAMLAIDRTIVEHACKNANEWFGAPLSPAVIKELYNPLVKESKQPDKYKPMLKAKIRTAGAGGTGSFVVRATDDQGEPFDVGNLLPGTTIKCIMEIAPMWFMNRQFGVGLTLLQMEITGLPGFDICRDNGYMSGFSFIKDVDDDMEMDSNKENIEPIAFKAAKCAKISNSA